MQTVHDTPPLCSFFVVVLKINKKIICNNMQLNILSMCIQNWINFYQSIPKVLNRNTIILTSIKSQLMKQMCNSLYLDFINIDAYIKFDKNPSINSQDIEHKQNSDVNQGP